MLNKSEVMMLIEQAGLDAQFRENSKNHWSDGVKKISEVPTYYQEHLVDYQLTVFKYVSENLIDISLVLYNDNKTCGVWPLYLDFGKKDPIKSINDNYCRSMAKWFNNITMYFKFN